MKVYLSGKITGLPLEQNRTRFADAQQMFEEMGFEVVNPFNNGLASNEPWEKHMVKDIEMLLGCDVIYLFSDWSDSRGATIEYDIANRIGLQFMFETERKHRSTVVLMVQAAIHEVMGMRLPEYSHQGRKRECVFARMIFLHQCRKRRMKLTAIAKYIHRDHSSMLHLLNKYNDEVKYNAYFRDIANRVDDILNKTKE